MATPKVPTTVTPFGTSEVPSWTGDMSAYTIPNTDTGTKTATEIQTEPLEATIASAPALQKVADIVSSINQRAWMNAPGRAEGLANIQRGLRGELDPAIYEQEAAQAAQTFGGGGFGVDTPAWQAAIQRAIVTNRQALQQRAGEELAQFYSGMPTTDVSRYTVSPTDYAQVLNAQRERELQLAELQQRGALETGRLAQERALAEQKLAFDREQLAQARELARAQAYASTYGSFLPTYAASSRAVQLPELTGTVAGGYRPSIPADVAASRARGLAAQRAAQAAAAATRFYNF